MKESDENNNNELKDYTSNFTKEDIEKGRTMAILCYLSILVLIPYFSKKKNPYVNFHAKQGMNILIYEVMLYAFDNIVSKISPGIGFLAYIGILFLIVLSLLAIINVISGEARELPIIEKIKIIK